MLALRSQALARAAAPSAARWASTAASSKDKFKVLVVGGRFKGKVKTIQGRGENSWFVPADGVIEEVPEDMVCMYEDDEDRADDA